MPETMISTARMMPAVNTVHKRQPLKRWKSGTSLDNSTSNPGKTV